MQTNGSNEKPDTARPATREEVEAIAFRNGVTIRYRGEVLNPNRERRAPDATNPPAAGSVR